MECIFLSKETGLRFLCEDRLSLHCSFETTKCNQENFNFCIKVQGNFRPLKSRKQKPEPPSLCFNFRDEESDSASSYVLLCQL